MEEKKKIKYFIDFDDTLFNRTLYGRRLFALLEMLGFTQDESLKAYTAVYDAGYKGIMAHLDKLAELYPDKLDQKRLVKAKAGVFDYLHKDLNKYLFPQAAEFLSGIDQDKYDIYLITVGGTDFQRAKVEDSGTANFFSDDHVIYTGSTSKEDALARYVEAGEHFILLDDKQATLNRVKDKFPDSLVLQAGGGELLRYLDPEPSLQREGGNMDIPSEPTEATESYGSHPR